MNATFIVLQILVCVGKHILLLWRWGELVGSVGESLPYSSPLESFDGLIGHAYGLKTCEAFGSVEFTNDSHVIKEKICLVCILSRED